VFSFARACIFPQKFTAPLPILLPGVLGTPTSPTQNHAPAKSRISASSATFRDLLGISPLGHDLLRLPQDSLCVPYLPQARNRLPRDTSAFPFILFFRQSFCGSPPYQHVRSILFFDPPLFFFYEKGWLLSEVPISRLVHASLFFSFFLNSASRTFQFPFDWESEGKAPPSPRFKIPFRPVGSIPPM